MKVVLDTNVLLSALIKTGKPRELIYEIVKQGAQLLTSKSVLEEFLEVAENPKIRRYVNEDEIILFLGIVGSIAKVVKVRSKFSVIKEDPDDDAILRTAKDGNANFIVSGDRHLLSLGEFRGIKILTVGDMLKILKKM